MKVNKWFDTKRSLHFILFQDEGQTMLMAAADLEHFSDEILLRILRRFYQHLPA